MKKNMSLKGGVGSLFVLGVVAVVGCSKDNPAASDSFTVKGKATTSTTSSSLRIERFLDRYFLPQKAIASTCTSGNQNCDGSVTSYKIKFYRFWVSTNEDCTSLQLIGDHGTSGKEFEITEGPTLFSGSPADGTYKCVAFEMEDTFTLVPDATAAGSLPGLCVAGTSTQQDIYRADGGTQPTGTNVFKDVDGNAITAHGDQSGSTNSPVSDKVFILASTNISAVTARGFSPNQLVTLTNSMVVPGQVTFTLDLLNHIEYSTVRCGMSQIPMSFN